MRRFTWLICGALVVGVGTAVLADDSDSYSACASKPTDAERKAAQGAFAAGNGSFNEADYKTAIMYWRDAYRRDCTAHALLLNLARAYELHGDKRAAIVALRTYLERNPDPASRPQIERRIENLEAQLKSTQSQAMAPMPDAGSAAQPAASVAPMTPSQPSVDGSGERTANVQPGSASDKTSDQHRSVMPWIAVGAGGLLTIVGAIVYAGGSSKVSDAEGACPLRKECAPDVTDDGNSGRSQMTIGGVLAGVGVAALAGGLVWNFAFNDPRSSTTSAKRPTLVPNVGPGFGGLSVNAQF